MIARTSLLAFVVLAAACAPRDGNRPAEAPRYVGRQACAGCHDAESRAWSGSDHALAMQEASASTVLGDFDGATLTQAGKTTTFSRSEGKYRVRTEGPDGAPHDYDVAYTFGVRPLQQYLVAFPQGRFQALGIAWDSRAREAGGQRWFHLYPGRALAPGDPLHWTGIDQTWNHMCAECHSTNLRKGFDPQAGAYRTTWSELDVSCEACHGPGSAHAAWAARPAADRARDPDAGLAARLHDMNPDAWVMDESKGTVRRTGPMPSRIEVETCARCHARAGLIDDRYVHGRSILDTHRPALIEQGLYFPDGQIRDEVYEYGSFLQSKMYARGVTCSDCHDPHTLKVRADGNALCARCHAPGHFDTPAHHMHAAGSPGARCVACHMPERTYMVVDRRRDHSIRVPRPELSARLGTPDACVACHADRDDAWAARAIAKAHGPPDTTPHYGEAFAAAWSGAVGAEAALLRVAEDPATAGIVRASALALLGAHRSSASGAALDRAAGDPDPLVRLGAVAALDSAAPEQRERVAARLLSDPVRAVRIEAASLLAPLLSTQLPPAERGALERGLAEYRETQLIHADRSEGHLNLGNLALASGDLAAAENEFAEAARIDPTFVPAHANLADALRAEGRDEQALAALQRGLVAVPGDPSLHHALGLALTRSGRSEEALAELERAVTLAPENARFAYVLGIALHSAGQTDRAVAILERAHRVRPADRDVLVALATIERDRGRAAAALRHARELLAIAPDDADARALAAELEAP